MFTKGQHRGHGDHWAWRLTGNYCKKGTFEDYVGVRGYERLGKKKWRQHVADVIARLMAALEPEYVVLGGGNVKKLQELPPGYRAGDNANAFVGGFRLWQETSGCHASTAGEARL